MVPSLHTDLHSTGAYDAVGCATIHIDGRAFVLSKESTDVHRKILKSMAQDAVLVAVKKENNLYYVKDQYQINNLGNFVNLGNYQISQEKSLDKGLSLDNKLSLDPGRLQSRGYHASLQSRHLGRQSP